MSERSARKQTLEAKTQLLLDLRDAASTPRARERICWAIVTVNWGFVRTVAKHRFHFFCGRDSRRLHILHDMEQEALIAAKDAADKYDREHPKQASYTTFASWQIYDVTAESYAGQHTVWVPKWVRTTTRGKEQSGHLAERAHMAGTITETDDLLVDSRQDIAAYEQQDLTQQMLRHVDQLPDRLRYLVCSLTGVGGVPKKTWRQLSVETCKNMGLMWELRQEALQILRHKLADSAP